MRHEPLGELNRVGRGQVRIFGAIESGQLGKIFEVNAWRAGLLEKAIPGLLAWRAVIFEFFQRSAHRKTDENDLVAARPKFFDATLGIDVSRLDRLLHGGHEFLRWNVGGRRRRRKQTRPAAADVILEPTTSGALLAHA